MKTIVIRGRRFNDMRGWDLDPQTRNGLRAKGIIKNHGTGGILLTSAMPLDEILLIPDEGLAETGGGSGGAPPRQTPEPRMAEAGLFRGAGQRSGKVGKMPVREAVKTEAIEQKDPLQDRLARLVGTRPGRHAAINRIKKSILDNKHGG